jgi:2-polyprenyl-6-methoxyphenol hydroxylase-like FAD-dependent oxidoreductase
VRWGLVGGGTAGPAAALLLARAGHDVVLFERVPDPKAVGAGILLQPTGLAVLRRLGLLQQVLAAGERVERLSGHTAGGRRVLDLAYGDLREGLYGLGIHRGALFASLWDAVRSEPRVELRTGLAVAALDEDADGVRLRGEAERGGEWRSERFDRVGVAAGARCPIRPPGASVRLYPWGALWFVADRNPHPGVLAQRYRDTRQMVGILPSGRGTVSVFWSVRADSLDAWRAAGLDAWKQEVSALMPEVPVEAVRHADDVIFAPYFDVVAPAWHHGRVAWLGDAGHAMSPQLGQGANLALQDAAALADATDLASYSAARRAQLRFYSFASRMLTPFFQSSWPVLAPARDLVAGPLHAWGWYRHQMLASLAGVKTGLFSELPLPE